MSAVRRWIARIAIGIVALLVVAVGTVYALSERKLSQKFPVPTVTVAARTDSASLARGEHLARMSCYGCHGEGLAGSVLIDDPAFGRLVAPNVSTVIPNYTDGQLATLLRRGIRADGSSPMLMPPAPFWHLSDDDLAAIIGYMRTVPAVASKVDGKSRYGVVSRALVAFNVFPVAAAAIDTTVPRVGADPAILGARKGEYLARLICADCHGAQLTGSSDGPAPAPSLSMALGYSLPEFTTLFREGKPREAGKAIPNMADVVKHGLHHLTDDELSAIHAYLTALPSSGVKLR